MTERRNAPVFYTVAAGTKKSTCRSPQCGRDIYFVDSLKTPGKKIPIDCSVIDGRVPTEFEDGSGIIHHIVCRDAERFRDRRPPARRKVQRELDVDHKAPHCIFCGCTNENACLLTLEEAGLTPEQITDGLTEDGKIGCSWTQMDPPICNNPKCLEQRQFLPLRMRLAKKVAP